MKHCVDVPVREKLADMIQWLKEHKASDVTSLDLEGRGAFTDALVVATATSVRHAQSLADGITALCGEKKYEYLGLDGYSVGQWILVDCNDVVVNIFQADTRSLYNLEALWSVPVSREALHDLNLKAGSAIQGTKDRQA